MPHRKTIMWTSSQYRHPWHNDFASFKNLTLIWLLCVYFSNTRIQWHISVSKQYHPNNSIVPCHRFSIGLHLSLCLCNNFKYVFKGILKLEIKSFWEDLWMPDFWTNHLATPRNFALQLPIKIIFIFSPLLRSHQS